MHRRGETDVATSMCCTHFEVFGGWLDLCLSSCVLPKQLCSGQSPLVSEYSCHNHFHFHCDSSPKIYSIEGHIFCNSLVIKGCGVRPMLFSVACLICSDFGCDHTKTKPDRQNKPNPGDLPRVGYEWKCWVWHVWTLYLGR